MIGGPEAGGREAGPQNGRRVLFRRNKAARFPLLALTHPVPDDFIAPAMPLSPLDCRRTFGCLATRKDDFGQGLWLSRPARDGYHARIRNVGRTDPARTRHCRKVGIRFIRSPGAIEAPASLFSGHRRWRTRFDASSLLRMRINERALRRERSFQPRRGASRPEPDRTSIVADQVRTPTSTAIADARRAYWSHSIRRP